MNLQELLQLGESYHQEFKETIDKSLVHEICAFANASGGKIFIGVSDDGTIKGVNFDNNTRSRLQDSIKFQGTENITNLDRKDYRADLISDIEDSIIFLRKHLNIAYKIEHIQREEILEIREVALREAVINAICHRNYFEKGANIVIVIFSDRVEISNPGGLPSGLSKESFGHKSVTRNPLIADLLHRIGYIEKIGTGIKRIKDAIAETSNCSVEFKIDEHWFSTIFYRNKTQKNNVTDNVTDNQPRLVQILNIIRSNPKVTTSELAQIFAVSKRTILRDIDKLKQSYIRRDGNERDGIWVVINQEQNK